MNRENEIILDVQNLKKYFPIRGGLITRTVGHVKAVDGISFKLRRGCLLYTSPSPRDRG